ncbi:MAG: metallophosphoesterase [Gammaproteobacteria bacterium]|nr:metallophosphoesterase [Gammaproteobacteria bacterium]
MKIQFASDLHLEMSMSMSNKTLYSFEPTDADVIVLAGDIHSHVKGVKWAAQVSRDLKIPVICVAGNHEYYGKEYFQTLQAMRDEAEYYPNVHFLENNSVIIDGVRFLGSTLWTDFYGDGSISIEQNLKYAAFLNDFRKIKYSDRPLKPTDLIDIHTKSKKWLTKELGTPFDGKTVVVTHHGPSRLTQHKRFEFDAISACFLTKLDHLVEQADLWIYGHSHSNLDTMIGECRLVSNQYGYPREGVPDHQPYDPAWVVKI